MTDNNDVYDGFNGWEGVIDSFFDLGYSERDAELKKALELNPEPDAVYFAEYGGGNYEGDALVAFRRGDKYYTVEGGHCSCYGLEGQFDPEEYDLETFLSVLDRRAESAYDEHSEYPTHSKQNFRLIKKRVMDELSVPVKKEG